MNTGIKKLGANIIKIANAIGHIFRHNKTYKSNYNPLPAHIVRKYNKTRMFGPQPILCYAPYKMMYFAFNGEVIACCHNRKNILGRYPEQSISEIWDGAQFECLRNYIQNDDLSFGCEVCKYALLAENFDGAKNGLYDRYSKKKHPQIMEFELDNKCNLSCVICNDIFSSSIDKAVHGKAVVSPYDKNFVEQLVPYIPYLKEAKFYGGEPFLINIYYDIWEKILEINPGVEMMIQTNGTVLNDRIKKLLERGRFHINISIDSLKKETFEKIRKNASYDQTMNNVAWFKEYSVRSHRHLGIIPTPNRLNWHDLTGLTNWASSLGAKVYFNTLITPLDLALWNLPAHELENIYKFLSQSHINTNSSMAKENARHFTDFLKQIQAWGIKNEATADNKTKINREQLAEMKEIFFKKLSIKLREINKTELFSLFENVYDSFVEDKNRALFFIAISKVPMDEVVEELSTEDFEHLRKVMGKKIYQAFGEFEINHIN